MENLKTLRSITNHPLRAIGAFNPSAKDFAEKLIETNKNGSTVNPDHEALRFYSLNQAVGLLAGKYTPNQALPEWAQGLVALYSKEMLEQHQRLVWYTFLVVSREWRHLKNLGTVSSGPQKSLLYPPELKALHSHIQDSQAESTLNSWLKQVPEMSLAKYCEALTHSFNTGSWGGGYGGKPWGNIAKTLWDYVGGKTSAEMFIDTAYTLAHNNGPMFNKGMLYGMYSSEFKIILDVQRSGQVCEGLLEGEYSGGTQDIKPLLEQGKSDLGLGDYVDWHKVEALGSLQQYPHKKAKQDKKYGAKPKMVLKDGKPIKVIGTYEWFPDKEVDIYERISA